MARDISSENNTIRKIHINNIALGTEIMILKIRILSRALFVCLAFVVPDTAAAQDKWFVTPNRSAEDGRTAAQIKVLFDENAERKAETGANANEISGLEAEVRALEAELATIQPHAKEALATCFGAGRVLQWDGNIWRCATEVDAGVGSHGRVGNTPPFCHPTNGKLIWASTNGGRWECHVDQTGSAQNDCSTAPKPTLASCGTGPYGHARIVNCSCTSGCGMPPKYQCYNGSWIAVQGNSCVPANNC